MHMTVSAVPGAHRPTVAAPARTGSVPGSANSLVLLLSLVFPDGASPSDLSAQQLAAAHAVLRSGLVEHGSVARLLRECNLPGDQDTWLPATSSFECGG
jgi:hypothetical protein